MSEERKVVLELNTKLVVELFVVLFPFVITESQCLK